MSVSAQKAAEIFAEHPARFTKKEKSALRTTLRSEMKRIGYTDSDILEINTLGTNFAVGNPQAEYIFTAHYDTPGRTGWMLGLSRIVGQTGANILMIFIMLLIIPLICAFFSKSLSGLGSYIEFWSIEVGIIAVLAVMIGCMIVKNKNNRNDNTSGVLSLLALAESVAADKELRGKCCFVFFDNEEWGLLGSAGFAEWCKKQGISLKSTKLINFDCVGNGDVLTLVSTKKTDIAQSVSAAFNEAGLAPVSKHSMAIFLSDHANFPNSVMVSYTKRSLTGLLYLPLIHTAKDVVCDVGQINRLTGYFYTFMKNQKI